MIFFLSFERRELINVPDWNVNIPDWSINVPTLVRYTEKGNRL